MKRGKFEAQPVAKKNSGKKLVSLLLVLVLLLGTVIGTTLAWLVASTNTITNTFTFGNITIALNETGAENNAKNYKLTPGKTVAKDPTITVNAGSEACWLFVKVTEANNAFTDGRQGKIVDWAIADGWTLVKSENDEYVYGREVAAPGTNTDFQVLAGVADDDELKAGKVTVSSLLTDTDIAAMTSAQPSLAFTAYAIQSADLTDTTADDNDTVDAIDAWTLLTAQLS